MFWIVALVLAGGRRHVALAAEAAADIGGKLAGGDDPVAVVVRLAADPEPQEVGEEAARLIAARDQAGQILLGAEHADHVRPVDQVAEAARIAGIEREEGHPRPHAVEQRRELGVGHRRVEQFDRLRPPVQLGRAHRHVDLVAMAGEEEQEQIVRAGRGGDPAEGGGHRGARRLTVGEHDARRVKHALLPQRRVKLGRVVVGIGEIGRALIIGDADQQARSPAGPPGTFAWRGLPGERARLSR